jgi:hypothetical protein
VGGRAEGKEAMRHILWFSCGAASAVASRLVLTSQPDAIPVRIAIASEHADNDRFAADCAQWFGTSIVHLRSTEYADVDDVIVRTREEASAYRARCSTELKKRVREDFQMPGDVQYFGFTWEEQDRAQRFRENNPEVDCRFPLIDAQLTKDDCLALIHRAGIALPVMYELGFRNNNCIGCVKANSLRYWKRIYEHFPEVYTRRAAQEREIGATVNRDRATNERWYLDELVPRLQALPDNAPDVSISCGILCEIAYQDTQEKLV